MHEFLASMGWYNSGVCGCTPKKYKWKNDTYPDMVFKTCPARTTWQLLEYDRQIRTGQTQSLESQYKQQFES